MVRWMSGTQKKMKKLLKIGKCIMYNIFDVIRVSFPFTDMARSKTRPALVISSYDFFGEKSGHSVAAMITSATNSSFPLDTLVKEYKEAGLPKPCSVRMKLFTIDNRLVIEKVGQLSKNDRQKVKLSLKKLLELS